MAVNIHNLIAAISPDVYCDKNLREEVKRIVAKSGYIEAASKAKLVELEYIDPEIVILGKEPEDNETLDFKSPWHQVGNLRPYETHKLVYDSFGEGLEPIYFWILDYISGAYGKTTKLIDNFASTTGSTYFGEMGQRATRMQEEAMKMLGAVNQVIKSILNIIYDLKEFETRLGLYDQYNSKDENKKLDALLSLKQVWLDTVDAKRGNTSIKGLAISGANAPNFVTLIDAFMAAETMDKVDKKPEDGGLDLNDRVRRLLQQRLSEFFIWIGASEKELRKRYELEKTYLRSQYNTVQLYSKWIKPYLVAAKNLANKDELYKDYSASLINAFSSGLFQLVVLGEKEFKLDDEIDKGDIPKFFKTAKRRKYFKIVVLEFLFRTFPERMGQQQGYAFRGRAEVSFSAYSLNEDELKVLKSEIEKDDIKDIMQLIEGATTNSLETIKEDLDKYLEISKKDKKEESESEDTNPFKALFSFFKSSKEDKKDLSKGIPEDNSVEKVFRSMCAVDSRKDCRKLYDNYKKAHSLPAF